MPAGHIDFYPFNIYYEDIFWKKREASPKRKKGTFFHATLMLMYETPKIEHDYVRYVYYCKVFFISFRFDHEQHCTAVHY